MDKKQQLTPVFQQYMELKRQYPDCLLLFRLGDFYECFFEDAVTVSSALELTLTGRECGLEERAPMCGVPHHAADSYIQKLLSLGHRVAVAEQMADPKSTKGMLPRDITRVITPGTVVDPAMLDERKNNILLSLCMVKGRIGLCAADISTGELWAAEIPSAQLPEEIARLQPTEILCNEAMLLHAQEKKLSEISRVPFEVYASSAFDAAKAMKTLNERFGDAVRPLAPHTLAQRAAGALLQYLEQHKNALRHMAMLRVYTTQETLMLDCVTRKNLELTETANQGKKGSLLWLLDHTSTAMGVRTLRAWIEQPLYSLEKIEERLGAVEALKGDYPRLIDLHDKLRDVRDMERLSAKASYNTLTARDCLLLARSLAAIPAVKALLTKETGLLQTLAARLNPLPALCKRLLATLCDDPPSIQRDGGIIREGVSAELDTLRRASVDGKQWIAALEVKEREETGIKTLKIGFNRVYGYYIEITKSYYEQVPYRYSRRQTLTNCERFITEELKQIEETVLGAEEKAIALEQALFAELCDAIVQELPALQETADALKQLDALQALAWSAQEYGYVRPKLHRDTELTIQAGRHPTVERLLNGFVSNDTQLDERERCMIITGPNMAGKSTYMRQVALIVLMAHIGSFVPADAARIPLTDRIFTRVGASDDISQGQSTFMVEMSEMAHILKNATPRSLLLIDEIGRGTSTYDGLSIAWAVAEYICDPKRLGAKTLFATHFHELSHLEGRLEGAVNYRITAMEHGEEVLFLRKIERGGTDKSFGVQVARLAGLPPSVIQRARRIMAKLEAADINQNTIGTSILGADEPQNKQLDLFSEQGNQLVEQLRTLRPDTLTPMDALQTLYTLHEKAMKV